MNRNVAFFSKLFDSESRQSAYDGSGDFIAWQERSRRLLNEILGIHRMKSVPLNVKNIDSRQREGYTCEKKLLTTEAGEEMPFFLLRPHGVQAGEKRPVVLCPHGHGFGGKAATAGETDDPRVIEATRKANADYGKQLVKRGCLVLCPDARGMGERRVDTSNPFGQECHDLSNLAQPLGRTVAGMWVFDLMRLLDYALTDEMADPQKVGCVGLSGGGMQTLLLTALDERIKAAVVSGYFYGFKQALLEIWFNCACNYIPHLWRHFDMGDIASLAAPRALGIETGSKDDLNGRDGIGNVLPQIEIAHNAYRITGHEERLNHFIFEGEHRFDGKKSLDFLLNQL